MRVLRLSSIVILSIGFCLTTIVAETRASQVIWTDWISGVTGDIGSATGELTIDGEVIDVSYHGEVAFIQTGSGPDYFSPSAPYISDTVSNAPPAAEMIGLSKATRKTLTFSKAITNPLFAVVSLNGNGYQFDRDFEILSYGHGYWGNGTLYKSNPSEGVFQLNGTGEPHGVIEFQGTFTSITWTSLTDEYWNGFTIGVRGLAPSVVPEPSALATSAIALVCAAGALARRRLSS